MGLLSILGKNLLYPVLPCLLVCDALYGYRCMSSTPWGLYNLIFFSLASVCMHIVAEMQKPH